MQNTHKIVSAMILILFACTFIVANGCGQKVAQSEGCPGGSYTANAADTITGPAAATITEQCGFGGGTVGFSPVTFTVSDAAGPKNNICLTIYTDGFYYTNHTYTTPLTGEGPMNKITASTDKTGKITLYWSTAALPASNPVVGTTAGKDQSGTSWIKVYSGTLTTNFDVNWTVSGCQP